ncbi:glucose-1-phosphate adenylyltransferase large subunit [Trifolium repens]|nr:glucose-1-phosphate adenylyltransferase large subunit [Trifolium repens]
MQTLLLLKSPKFEFYDPKTPIFTSPGFLSPSKIDNLRVVNATISHGYYGVELQDAVMMGADYYQTESEIASLLAEGKEYQN